MDRTPPLVDQDDQDDRPPALDRFLLGFARELRADGFTVGTGDGMDFCAAVTGLDPSDLVDVYWAGRATLVTRREQVPRYHEAFLRYFLDGEHHPGDPRPWSPRARAEARSVLDVPETESGSEAREQQQAELGLVASPTRTDKHKAFAACTPEELAALRRIMRAIRLTPPRRTTRRTTPARRGRRPDVRRTVRDGLRVYGDPARLHWRRRRRRPRPVVLLLDVSGSMADYSRHLVQFAHTSLRAGDRVEVFCFGTRLTRITRALDQRRPDVALDNAAASVGDWEGGTRIGDCLDAYVRGWARAGRCRGAVVVVCSDGLDRGDPAVLERAARRLAGLCHRVVWLNPHVGVQAGPGAPPPSVGMTVVAPYVDLLRSCRDLASLEDFVDDLAGLR